MSNRYIELRRNAKTVKDDGLYNLAAGEMNPRIFEKFAGVIQDREILPVIWEPFAGTSYSASKKTSRILDIAHAMYVETISYGLDPKDGRIKKADSTKTGPNKPIGGVLFHPPYFGSMPMSEDRRELSLLLDRYDYLTKLNRTVTLIKKWIVPDGLVCAVARDYRHAGNRISLSSWYLDLFESNGFVLEDVWSNLPDMVLLFRWKI